MNKPRRKALNEIYDKLAELLEELESLKDDEADCLDNIPENLQGSERYEKAEEAFENLDCAVDSLNDVLEYIETATK